MTDKDTDAFFAALAGKNGTDEGTPAAAAFGQAARSELQARKTWEDAFLNAPASEPQPDDAAQADRLMAKLQARGLFREAPPQPVAKAAGTPSMLAWLRKTLLGDDWLRPMAVAASVALVSVLVLQPFDRDDAGQRDGEPTMRGSSDDRPVFVVENAEQLQQRLVSELEAAGAHAVAAQIGAQPPRWRVVVQVPDTVDAARVQQILQGAGVTVPAGPALTFDLASRP